MRTSIAFAVVLTAGLTGGRGISAQVTAADVREVVAMSKAAENMEPLAAQMIQLVGSTTPARDTAVVNAVIRTHFSSDSLIASIVAHLQSSADPATFRTLKSWLLADSIRVLDMRADSASDREPLEAYAARLRANRPAETRIQLATEFVVAQRAAEFYVQFLGALRESAAVIGKAAGSTGPLPQPFTPGEIMGLKTQSTQVTFVSFLQRFDALTEAEVRRLVTAYQSPSGAWYVTAYTTAVATAIRKAAASTAAALS